MNYNPATGLPDDEYPDEYPSGQVAQQERDAAIAPTFISSPAPAATDDVTMAGETGDLGGGDQAGMEDIGSAESLPALPDPSAEPVLASNDLAAPEGPAGPDLGADASEPATPDLVSAPPTVDSDGNATGAAVPAAGPALVADASPAAAQPAEAPAPLSPVDQITADRVKLAEREGAHREELARIEQRRIDAETERKIEAQKQTDQIIVHAEARLAESNARRQAEYDRFRDMSVADSWGDHGTLLRVMAGISMLLGGRAGGGAYIVGASQGLEENKRTQLALQEKRMEAAGKSHEEAKAQTAEEFANFKMHQAAALDVTAARAEQEKRGQGIEEAKIATDKDILQIKAAAEAAKIEARKLATKEAEQKLKDDLAKHAQDRANDLAESTIKLHDAQIAKMGKGKGGGKGGVSLKEQHALTREQAAAENRLNKEVNDWKSSNNFKKNAEEFDTAKSVADRLKHPDINGVEAAGLLMSLDAAHRGGVATAISVDQVNDHLGGGVDKLKAWLQKNENGKLPEQYVNTLREVANNLQADRQKKGMKLHDEFVNQFYVEDPRYSKDPFLHAKVTARDVGMFGRYGVKSDKARERESAAGAPQADIGRGAPVGDVKAYDAQGKTKTPEKKAPATPSQSDFSAARAIVANPKDPDRAEAMRFLRQWGQSLQ